jgi:dihydroorotase
MTLNELMNKMSTNPANVLNLDGGEIKEGGVADLAIVDLNQKYVIDGNKFYSKGKNTPFNGWGVYGKVLCTIVDGDVKFNILNK